MKARLSGLSGFGDVHGYPLLTTRVETFFLGEEFVSFLHRRLCVLGRACLDRREDLFPIPSGFSRVLHLCCGLHHILAASVPVLVRDTYTLSGCQDCLVLVV